MAIDINILLRQIAEESNVNAFEKLHQIYFQKAYTFALYFLKSPEWAEEVVSDTFLNIWQNRNKLNRINDWDSYFYISVRNQAFLYLDQIKKKNHVPLDSYIVQLSMEETPENIFLKKELTKIIQNAVESLPEKCRMVYCMVREDGLSYKQVGEIMEISERTVNTQITKAVRIISDAIRRYLTDPPVSIVNHA